MIRAACCLEVLQHGLERVVITVNVSENGQSHGR
jgi:hypothetical protein